MAILSRVIGDCPGCRGVRTFGNVEVYGTYVYRGCKRCRYNEHFHLPALRKKVIYLDQFFFSHAFRGREERFVEAARLIADLASKQLLVAPYSSIHEDETFQWERREELHEFIKSSARGHEFEPAYDVERDQIVKAFQRWNLDESTGYELDHHDALDPRVHDWDGYFRIDVGRYLGDIELIRTLKKEAVEQLVGLFDGWRASTTSFEDDLQAEFADAGRSYIDFYLRYVARVGSGDIGALLDAPMASKVVETMMHSINQPKEATERFKRCARFLTSDFFKALPYQWLSAHLLATLKQMVKSGAYTNRERAIQKLSGVFYDVKHIATYAPYVDAFVMDQPMADLVSRPTVRLRERCNTKVFCQHNWEDFLEWLHSLEASMTEEHRAGLIAAYSP